MKCEHGQKIIKFCISDSCRNAESGGCESCFKKYHGHIGHSNFMVESQLTDAVKFLTSLTDSKPKAKPFCEAIYNYFNIMQSQISSSLNSISRSILNRLAYPYVMEQGQLSTFKKIKNKEYRKLNTKEMKSFNNFKKGVNLEELKKKEKILYLNEVDKATQTIKKINALFDSYSKLISDFDKNFTNELNFYNKIFEISGAINREAKKDAPKDFSKEPKSEKKDKPQEQEFKIIISPEKPKQTSFTYESSKQCDSQTKSKKGMEVKRQISLKTPDEKRQRRVSIDTSCNEPIVIGITNLNSYDQKEREIEERKKKLFEMLENKQSKKKSETISKTSESQKKSLSSEVNSINSETGTHSSKSNEKDPEKLFSDLAAIGINIPDVVALTMLPVAEEKHKLYEHADGVQKHLVKIPMKKIEEVQQCQSPMFKKRKNVNNEFCLELVNSYMADSVYEKSHIMDTIVPQQQELLSNNSVIFGEQEAKSINLLTESIKKDAVQAIDLLKSSLRYCPNNLSAAEYLSFLLLETNQAKECLDVCNQVLEMIGESPERLTMSIHILNNKAAALNALGRSSESIGFLEECLCNYSQDILYKNLGDAYFSLGIHEKAVCNYEKTVELNPNFQEAHYNLAVCFYFQNNFNACQLAVQHALKTNEGCQAYRQLYDNADQKLKAM